MSRLLLVLPVARVITFRKAMGKKIREKLDTLKPKISLRVAKQWPDEKILRRFGRLGKSLLLILHKSQRNLLCMGGYQTAYLKGSLSCRIYGSQYESQPNDIMRLQKLNDDLPQGKILMCLP